MFYCRKVGSFLMYHSLDLVALALILQTVGVDIFSSVF